MRSTTPPPSKVEVPPAPLHGSKFDDFGPVKPRRSTRSNLHRSRPDTQTPPSPKSYPLRPTSPLSPSATPRPKRSIQRISGHTLSPPPSTYSSPQTHRSGRGRMKNPGKTTNGFGNAGDDDKLVDQLNGSKMPPANHGEPGVHSILPTPAKTPRKKGLESTPELSNTARILFPSRPENVDEAMPSLKKKSVKKYQGFTLGSIEDEANEASNKISIYTDSRDRVPELDTHPDNPFYVKRANVQYPMNQVNTDTERRAEVEAALNREDGHLFYFRGKPIFRKFEKEADDSSDDGDESESNSFHLRPLRRTDFKPRLLFPTKEQSVNQDADEEALTDIDEPALLQQSGIDITPKSSKHALASPPVSGRGARTSSRQVKQPDELHPSPGGLARRSEWEKPDDKNFNSPEEHPVVLHLSPDSLAKRFKNSEESSPLAYKGKKRESDSTVVRTSTRVKRSKT